MFGFLAPGENPVWPFLARIFLAMVMVVGHAAAFYRGNSHITLPHSSSFISAWSLASSAAQGHFSKTRSKNAFFSQPNSVRAYP